MELFQSWIQTPKTWLQPGRSMLTERTFTGFYLYLWVTSYFRYGLLIQTEYLTIHQVWARARPLVNFLNIKAISSQLLPFKVRGAFLCNKDVHEYIAWWIHHVASPLKITTTRKRLELNQLNRPSELVKSYLNKKYCQQVVQSAASCHWNQGENKRGRIQNAIVDLIYLLICFAHCCDKDLKCRAKWACT